LLSLTRPLRVNVRITAYFVEPTTWNFENPWQTTTAQVVKSEWHGTSSASTIGSAPAQPSVASAAVLRQFGEEELAALQSKFANFVTAPMRDDFIEARIRSKERTLGDAAFKRSVNSNALDETLSVVQVFERCPSSEV
jgi:hypothetical protein